jgi:seryl-tRNA synthetase
MLDIDFIRNNVDKVRWAVKVKGFDVDIDRLLELDEKRRKFIAAMESRREAQNKLSKTIPTLSPDARQQAAATVKASKLELASLEQEFAAIETEFSDLMLRVPNVPSADAPVGTTDADNIEVSRWGEIPNFAFTPKDHVELGANLGLFEFERSRRYAGSRSYSLTGLGVLLERAVIQFTLEVLHAKGFLPIAPPIMVRDSALFGTGFFPIGEAETYAIERDRLYLAGTSEVSLVAQHMDEILDLSSLPRRYVGVSPCFRREAGSAGRDTRGLYRVHMFNKVEQVSIGQNDEQWSRQEHFRLLENSLEILRAFELPHRVAIACTGEMGMGQVLKHEIESWMPSRGAYSETHSCSTMHEFQARRSKIRYRDERDKPRFVHTLNNTAIATPRIFVPLLECHQREDGSVMIPRALRRFMDNREIIEPVHASAIQQDGSGLTI